MNYFEFDFLREPLFWMMAVPLFVFTVSTLPIFRNILQDISKKLGTDGIPLFVFAAAGMIWATIFFALLYGIYQALSAMISATGSDKSIKFDDFRWVLLTLAAIMGALSAVIALPFTLIRTKQNGLQTERALQQTDIAQKQADVAEQGHITDRINTAVQGLGAMKTLKASAGDEEIKPNIEVRIGAIYALERIAQDSDRDHVQIMEILCAYIRHNAPESEAQAGPAFDLSSENAEELAEDWPDRPDAYKSQLHEWTATLKPRDDIQIALTVIGRRSNAQLLLEARANGGAKDATFAFAIPCPKFPDDGDADAVAAYQQKLTAWQNELHSYAGYRLDLRGTDLQGADLSSLRLQAARFDRSLMLGADLSGVQMQGADLSGVQMQGAYLSGAKMQGADLSGAKMQGAYLFSAEMQGADLSGAKMDKSTELKAANFSGSALSSVDYTTVQISRDQINSAFGDASVTLPGGVTADHPNWPAHWPKKALGWEDFQSAY